MVKRFRTDSISVLTECITTNSFAFLIEFKEQSFTQVKLYVSFDQSQKWTVVKYFFGLIHCVLVYCISLQHFVKIQKLFCLTFQL